MRMKVIIFTALTCIVTCIGVIVGINRDTIFSSYKEEANENFEVESVSGYEKVTKKDVDDIKIKGLNSAKINAKYAYSQNLSSNNIDKIFDEYSVYDIYEDEENEYIYLDNTDICCGARKKNSATNPDETIEEKEATAIAEKFFVQVNGKDSGYTFTSSEYVDWANYYEYIWTKYINDMKTDDRVSIWVDGSGEIIAYSAFKMNRYDDIKLNEEKLTTARTSGVKEYVESDNYEVCDSYISYDENGKLVLVNVVETFIPSGEFNISDVKNINVPLE